LTANWALRNSSSARDRPSSGEADGAFDADLESEILNGRQHFLDALGRASASVTPRRRDTRTPNSLPPVRARTSPPEAPTSAARKGDQQLVAGEAAHASLMREKRSMSTTSTACCTSRRTLSSSCRSSR
jgi:hypothetical protein